MNELNWKERKGHDKDGTKVVEYTDDGYSEDELKTKNEKTVKGGTRVKKRER